jgi:hypothetical protein
LIVHDVPGVRLGVSAEDEEDGLTLRTVSVRNDV